ncbi:acyl carrier protein [candidate division WOR-3 bacterium]|nr:acyl carrier protein [candidate division WOR-3 bacterium]
MTLYKRVKRITIKYIKVPEERVTPEASFTDDLGADSLNLIEIIMDIEKDFGIDIPDEDGERFKTVGDVVEYLRARLSANE